MTAHRLAGLLMVGGSVVFLVGAAVGVPAVFTERDPDARLRLLRAGLTRWRLAQPLYALGPLVVAAGVGVLADGPVLLTAFLAVAVGALAWTWSVVLRGVHVARFARGTLPAWPFRTYVLSTIGGLALLAVGLLAQDVPWWLGCAVLGLDVLFLVAYLRLRDIPPFVFYLVFIMVGVVLW